MVKLCCECWVVIGLCDGVLMYEVFLSGWIDGCYVIWGGDVVNYYYCGCFFVLV